MALWCQQPLYMPLSLCNIRSSSYNGNRIWWGEKLRSTAAGRSANRLCVLIDFTLKTSRRLLVAARRSERGRENRMENGNELTITNLKSAWNMTKGESIEWHFDAEYLSWFCVFERSGWVCVRHCRTFSSLHYLLPAVKATLIIENLPCRHLSTQWLLQTWNQYKIMSVVDHGWSTIEVDYGIDYIRLY